MDWHGSPTAVTGCPPPNNERSSASCAWLVSWYSSSSTTWYRARSPAPTSGCLLAIRAARATWSPWSSTSRAAFAAAYRSTSGNSCSLAR